jgi:hypothetical protein
MRKKFTLEDDTQTKKKLWKWKIFLTGGDEQQDATETKTIDRKKKKIELSEDHRWRKDSLKTPHAEYAEYVYI